MVPISHQARIEEAIPIAKVGIGITIIGNKGRELSSSNIFRVKTNQALKRNGIGRIGISGVQTGEQTKHRTANVILLGINTTSTANICCL